MNGAKLFPILTVLLFLLMGACQTTSSEQEELNYIPGDVIISLEEGVTESEIKPRIEELELAWEEYFEHLGTALIGVPVGEEEIWVTRLKEVPLIRNAHLNRKVDWRDSGR